VIENLPTMPVGSLDLSNFGMLECAVLFTLTQIFNTKFNFSNAPVARSLQHPM
jgi:hypothetical protein